MTGPVAFGETSGMPWADVLNRYQALTDRDAMARAIATLQARGQWNDDRSIKPEDYPPLTADEHLELIALGEVMARRYRHPAPVHYAVVAGATWDEIAPPPARTLTRRGRPTGMGRGTAPPAQRLPRRDHRPRRR